MASLEFTITQKSPKKVTIEFDADKFERLAASFGFLNPELIKRLDKAERDVKAGKIRKINSLKDLR